MAQAQKRPHILILTADQLRADSMGCAGHPRVKTPVIDSLANDGMRFSNCHTVSPVCQPSRVSFITGTYPHNHGIWYNRGELPINYPTLFSQLRDAGYHTATVGKSHLWSHKKVSHLCEGEPYLQALGFDVIDELGGPRGSLNSDSYFTDYLREKDLFELFVSDTRERVRDPKLVKPAAFEEDDHMDGYVGRRSVEFVDSAPEDRPTCLFVNFPGPHDPWDAPGKYATMYDPADSPPAIGVPPRPATLPDEVAQKEDFKTEPGLTAEIAAAIRANYDGKITFVDHWCGEILAAYERRGWLDDLCVVFWSDHGEMTGDHGRVFKRTFHESALRVPLILRWPGRIPSGTVCDALVETIDVGPALLEALGLDQLQMSLGQSLGHLFVEPTAHHRTEVLSEIFYGGSRNTMVKTDRYKYVMDQHGRGYMLYDMQQDPDEQHNLIGDPEHRGTENEMRDTLLRRLAASAFVMDSVNL